MASHVLQWYPGGTQSVGDRAACSFEPNAANAMQVILSCVWFTRQPQHVNAFLLCRWVQHHHMEELLDCLCCLALRAA